MNAAAECVLHVVYVRLELSFVTGTSSFTHEHRSLSEVNLVISEKLAASNKLASTNIARQEHEKIDFASFCSEVSLLHA